MWHLKVKRKFFNKIISELKTAEIREHSEIQEGDILHLYCTDNPYNDCFALVSDILHEKEFPQGLKAGYNIYSLIMIKNDSDSEYKYKKFLRDKTVDTHEVLWGN